MKTLKKLLSVFAVVAMLLSMTVSANAATVTVEGPDHDYVAYQILSGTQGTDASLGDPAWGTGINSTKFVEELNKIDAFKDVENAADFVAVLAGKSDDCAEAKAAAKAAYLAKTSGTKLSGTVDLAAGYYLIVDEAALNAGDAKNASLLQITNKGDITIGDKASKPTITKKVAQVEVADGETVNWVDSTDRNIADEVTFKITATIPKMTYYETYKAVITDTDVDVEFAEPAADDITVVLVQGATTTPALTAGTDYTNANMVFTINDLKALATAKGLNVNQSIDVVITYTTTLSAGAKIAAANTNTVGLNYPSNPDDLTERKDSTPDTADVLTYKFTATKIDGNDNTPLAGVEFALKGDKGYAVITDGKVSGWSATVTDSCKLITDSEGKIALEGLANGTYLLEEITPKEGYNSIDPTPVTINNDTPHYTIKNYKGATLPETGGIGTTMFYVIGAALVIGAGVVLVSKKRMAAK